MHGDGGHGMTIVVDLAAARRAREAPAEDAQEPHWAGKCVCLGCRYEWVGVGPIGVTTGLECPACHLPKGVCKHPFGGQEGDAVLTCAHCGCEALTVYRRAGDGLKVFKCMACGTDLTEALFDG